MKFYPVEQFLAVHFLRGLKRAQLRERGYRTSRIHIKHVSPRLLVNLNIFSFTVCSEAEHHFHTLLGKSIYVPREDLLGDIPNGISFYTEIPDECKRKVNLATTTKDQSFYKNTGEFYKSIATETGLDAKYEGHFSLGASLDVTTKSVSGSKREVSGTSLNLATKAYEEQVKPNCLYNAEKNSRLVRDLSALQKKIASPWHKSSWRDYQRYSLGYIWS